MQEQKLHLLVSSLGFNHYNKVAFRGSIRIAGGGKDASRPGMFLTRVLFRNRIPGKQWIGKHRQPRFVSPLMKANMIRRLEIEAENEYWLSCSYMTKEQEYRHNEENVFALKQQKIAEQKAKFPEHKYASEYLKHLNVSKRWADS